MGKLSQLASALTEGVKVNAAWREVRNGRPIWFKRRRSLGGPILRGANLFFALAQAPVRALALTAEWQRWEVDSFAALHGAEGFRAFAEGNCDVGVEEMPGENLTNFLDGGTMTPPMAAAAARELRRAHALPGAYFGGNWSHGDAHAGNFVYDPATERARLIDFELRHRGDLSTEARQRDDVLGFLLDMVGRIAPGRWRPCALAFLDAYACAQTRAEVTSPESIAPSLWLKVRTTFLPRPELTRRWSELNTEY
jgi:hypothetical protein